MKRTFTRVLLFAFILLSSTMTYATSDVTEPTNPTPVEKEKVESAVKEFKSLSKQERKSRMKEARKVMKEYRAAQKSGATATGDVSTVLLVILAILLPPLAVYLHEGAINTKFWISLVLTLLFWIPGVIYALLVVLGGA
jgi:uncharacterized membrane protein YqaE (UPF0057 family)